MRLFYQISTKKVLAFYQHFLGIFAYLFFRPLWVLVGNSAYAGSGDNQHRCKN